MKKPYIVCLLFITLSFFNKGFLFSQDNNREKLETLFNDWRQFEFPPLKKGAPDYSYETFNRIVSSIGRAVDF